MSVRELEKSNVSFINKEGKNLEAGISFYSLKSFNSDEEIKPSKNYIENGSNTFHKNYTNSKIFTIKKKNINKIISKFSKTVKEENLNNFNLNRDFKYSTDDRKKMKKMNHSNSPKINDITNTINKIKLIDYDCLLKEKISEKKIQKEIKLLNNNINITNLDKHTKIIETLKKVHSNNNILFNHYDKEKYRENYYNNQINNIYDNYTEILSHTHKNVYDKLLNKKEFQILNDNININPNISINKSSKNSNFKYKNACLLKTSTNFSEINKTILNKDNSEDKSYTSFSKKKILEKIDSNNYGDFPLNHIDCLKTPTDSADFYFLFSENKIQNKKTLMNFNKNPGLIKRGNFRFSSTNFYNNKINLDKEYDNQKINFNEKSCNHNFMMNSDNEKLPIVNTNFLTHKKKKNLISTKLKNKSTFSFGHQQKAGQTVYSYQNDFENQIGKLTLSD